MSATEMQIKACSLTILILTLLLVPMTGQAQADPASSKEYQIKAAFLYNFINFVDWPEEKLAGDTGPVIIGIIGTDPFGKAFEPIKDKQVKGKKVVIERFKGFEELRESDDQIEAIRQCHLLFICSSEKDKVRKITEIVKDHSVLTVGDTKAFLDSGGIINFLMVDKKVRFEIHNDAAEQAKLKVRSKLLRLAKKVIPEKAADGEEN